MLVVMTGGIDLSVAGTISLLANVPSVSRPAERPALTTVLVVLAVAIVIGLVNGFLIAILGSTR